MSNEYFQVLERMCRELLQVKAIALVDLKSEQVVSKILSPTCACEVICTVLPSIVDIVEKNIQRFGRSQAKEIWIKGKQGFIIIHRISQELVISHELALLLFTSYKIDRNIVKNSIRQSAKEILQLIATSST